MAGIITYGIVGLPDNLDPHNQAVPNDFATRIVFDALLAPGPEGELECALAESYRPLDQTTWEFVLRDGVCFASGRALTAEAVRWNFERLRANPRLLAAARIPTYDSCAVIDDRTLRFRTTGPDAIWPRRVLQVVIADPEELGDDPLVQVPTPGAGTGLFAVVESRPGELVAHEAVAGTWRGRAKLDGIRMVPYSPSALLEALISGEADFGYLSGEAVEQGLAAGLLVQHVLQANTHMIRFNSTVPPFRDRRLREAVALCVDRGAMLSSLYRGQGRVPTQLVGPDCFGYDPSLKLPGPDLERARVLVEQVGGTPNLTMDILSSSAVLRPWGEAVASAMNSAGLIVELAFVDLPTYLGKLAANRPPRSDLIGAGNQYGPGMDAEFSLNKFSAKLPPEQVEYDNPRFQILYDASQREFDSEQRRSLLRAATRVLLDDFGTIPIYQPMLSWLINPRVEALRMNTIGAGWIDWREVAVRRRHG